MAQQTAVEWLVEQLRMQTPLYTKNEMIEIAKQMEREQRIAAQMDMFHHMNNADYGLDYLQKRDEAEKYAEQYYNETYGK